MFKRRTPPGYLASIARWVWPRGGWVRALWYMVYRLRRLPDPAYRISRGIAVGIFVCFTPFFGLHFLLAAALCWLIGGNVLASLLATFFGNPVTFPLIAGVSVELGSWMLGIEHPLPLNQTFNAFSQVSIELWHNAQALFTDAPVTWDRFHTLLSLVFLPYLVGGIPPGLLLGGISYVVSRPIISAYQKARIARMKKRFAKRRRVAQDSSGKRIDMERRI